MYQGGDCCNGSLQNFPDSFDKEICFPIDIPENDSYFSTIGRRCMNFNRAMQTPNLKCELGKREQVCSILILNLRSLINKQTIINKQGGKKFLFLLYENWEQGRKYFNSLHENLRAEWIFFQKTKQACWFIRNVSTNRINSSYSEALLGFSFRKGRELIEFLFLSPFFSVVFF